jgi:hypothetical protein
MTRYLLLSAALLTPAPVAAQPYLWREAESQAKADPAFQPGGWGRSEYLSGGRWLFATIDEKDVPAKVPAAGTSVVFELPVEQFGKFEVWARVGYEFARSPFRWRIDGGAWAEVTPGQFTTDLMAVADFAEVAWLKLGDADLPAGTRKLEINAPRPGKGRFLFGLDCVLATRAPFRPNGPHKPDAVWKTPADKDAEGVVFEFPRRDGNRGLRDAVALGGTWQVARFDEPGDVEDRTGPIKELPDLGKLHWKAIRAAGPDVLPPAALPLSGERAGRPGRAGVRPAVPEQRPAHHRVRQRPTGRVLGHAVRRVRVRRHGRGQAGAGERDRRRDQGPVLRLGESR